MSSGNSEARAVQRRVIMVGALLAASGVALGAFGAHGLRALLAPAAFGWWETAVAYQMWHAIGLLAIGATAHPRMAIPATLIATGTVVFSGTLYMMALGGPRWLGMITPSRRHPHDSWLTGARMAGVAGPLTQECATAPAPIRARP